jgi:hypothetical protein
VQALLERRDALDVVDLTSNRFAAGDARCHALLAQLLRVAREVSD